MPRDILDAYLAAIAVSQAAQRQCELAHAGVEVAWDRLRLAVSHFRADLLRNGPVVDARTGVMFSAHDEVTGIESKPMRII